MAKWDEYLIEETAPQVDKWNQYIEERPAQLQKPRTFAEYILPSFMTKYQEKPGERTFWGDIGQRPDVALGSLISGQGYRKGAISPETAPTIQEALLDKYWRGVEKTAEDMTPIQKNIHRILMFPGGLGVSTAGLMANPLNLLLTSLGLTPQAKKIGQAISETKPAKAIGRFITKERHLPGRGLKQKLFPSELKQVKTELSEIQKQLKIEPKKYKPEYIKTKLGELTKEKGITIKNKIDEVKLETVKTIDSLKAKQRLFDEKLTEKATDMAKLMKDAGPKWVKSGTEKYGQLIDDISNNLQGEFTADDIYSFLDDTIKNIEDKGLSGKTLRDLYNLRNKYDIVFDKYGIEILREAPNFSKFKTEMASIYRQISPQLKSGIGLTSDDAIVTMTKSKWLDFIGNMMPETEKVKFLNLQNKYRQFAQAKTAMGQAFHPYSGQYDMNKGINSALQFAEQKKAEGINNLMKTLETGIDDYIPGIKDIKIKAQTLKELGAGKQAIKETYPVIKKSEFISQKQLNKEKIDYVNDIFKWKEKTDDLLARKQHLEEQRTRLFKYLRNIGIGIGIEETIRRRYTR